MTTRLYHNDPYLRKFSSEVVKETEVNGKPGVILEQTACTVINGRGGGQPHQAQGGGPEVEKLENALQIAEDTLFDK
jgi:alanyl-tRNA synthetase